MSFGESKWGRPVRIGRQVWLPHVTRGHIDSWVLIHEERADQ